MTSATETINLTADDYMKMLSHLSIDARERVLRSLLSHPGVQPAFERAFDEEKATCPDCNGTGDDPNHTYGSGDLPVTELIKDLRPACETCNGFGSLEDWDADNSTACMMCGTTAHAEHRC